MIVISTTGRHATTSDATLYTRDDFTFDTVYGRASTPLHPVSVRGTVMHGDVKRTVRTYRITRREEISAVKAPRYVLFTKAVVW